MITKDTSLYNNLFEKANKLLNYTEENSSYIRNIDMYFQNLGKIAEKANGDISYFMLPIEEPLFEINANTRTISIPDAFKNGLSVQGDEIAETIFFSIDRYFDTTDFYNDYIVPVIQWRYTDEKDYHLSAATGKVVIEDSNSKTGGKVKVVFGWPISSEVTRRATNLQFGVRFYTVVDDRGELIINPDNYGDGTVEYSFSTLNAVTKISPSLEINLNDGNYKYHDKNNLIWARMRNSKPANLNLQAIMPIIEYYEPGAGALVDLNENGVYIIKAKATYPSGTVVSRLGKQIYQIMRNEEKDPIARGEIIDIFNNDIIGDDFQIDYVLTSDKTRNDRDIYYTQEIIDGEEIYSEYNEVELHGKLYKKVYTYPVNSVGKYYIQITNQLEENNKATVKSGTFEIISPMIPIVGNKNDNYNIIIRDKLEQLSLTVGNLPEEEEQTYQWYRAEEENGEKTLIADAINLTHLTDTTGYYYLKVYNERNGAIVEGINSKPIRVTQPATLPLQFSYKSGPYEVSETFEISPNLGLTVIPFAERADSFKYQWYSENKPNVLIGAEDTIIPKFAAGTVIYCKVASVYNGDVSEFVETARFTIVDIG